MANSNGMYVVDSQGKPTKSTMFRKRADELAKRLEKELQNSVSFDYDYTKERVTQSWGEETFPGQFNWSNETDWIMFGLGSIFGTGNITNFPILCIANGGIIFLIPYFFALIVLALPLSLIEVALGQYTNRAVVNCWKMAPLFKALGFGLVLYNMFVLLSYPVPTAWSLTYSYKSLEAIAKNGRAEWLRCDHSFNTEFCELHLDLMVNETNCNSTVGDDGYCYRAGNIYGIWNITMANLTYPPEPEEPSTTALPMLPNTTTPEPPPTPTPCEPEQFRGINEVCYTEKPCKYYLTRLENGVCYNGSAAYGIWNHTVASKYHIVTRTAAQEYYLGFILESLNSNFDFENLGGLTMASSLSLGIVWLLVALFVFYGMQSYAKITYITMVIPVIVFSIFTIMILSLPNALNGVYEGFLVRDDWEVLTDRFVWSSAAKQALFSTTSIGGWLIIMAQFNSFHNNLVKSTFIFIIGDTLMSLLGTLLVLGALGHYLHIHKDSGETLLQVALDHDMTFEMIPEQLGYISPSPWLVLMYFVAIFLLGFDSQLVYIELVIEAITDVFPNFMYFKRNRISTVTGLVLCCYFCNYPICKQGGNYVHQYMNAYSSGPSIMIIGILECCIIAWVYGAANFKKDVAVMMGNQTVFCIGWNKLSRFYVFCWKFVTPSFLFFTLTLMISDIEPLTVRRYVYPEWSHIAGLLFFQGIVIAGIVFGCCYSFSRTKGTLKERYDKLFKPSHNWGPYLVKYRVKVVHLGKQFNIDPELTGPSDNFTLEMVENRVGPTKAYEANSNSFA